MHVIIPVCAAAVVACLLGLGLARRYLAWLIDARQGLTFGGEFQDNWRSKLHLLRQIRRARYEFSVLCGSLLVDVWDTDVRDELGKALDRHPQLRIRILTGPEIDADPEGSHPVYDWYKQFHPGRLEIRHLSNYPHEGQGRYSDGDIYLEIWDSRESIRRPFVTLYRDYVPNDRQAKAAAFLKEFDRLWEDGNRQIPDATICKKAPAEGHLGNSAA